MASIILECPHCGAEKIGFRLVFDQPAALPIPGSPHAQRWRTLMVCSNCDEGVVAIFDKRPGINVAAPTGLNVDPQKLGMVLVDTYPKSAPSKIPTHLTDELKNYYNQAAESLRRGNWDASGAMSRKVVDVSTQLLLKEEAKKHGTIQARIDALAANNALTPDLKDWGHQVRLGGNDAAHDKDPFTKPEADELLDFTELYLTYVYTLPGRLEERKKRAAEAKASAAPKPS